VGNKPIHKDLGYYLRVYRAERHLSQLALANELDITPSHLSLLENGKRFPGREMMTKIRRLTGAPIHALLGDGEK
jgi:transcriptional regulator with XRE-family HTH domain